MENTEIRRWIRKIAGLAWSVATVVCILIAPAITQSSSGQASGQSSSGQTSSGQPSSGQSGQSSSNSPPAQPPASQVPANQIPANQAPPRYEDESSAQQKADIEKSRERSGEAGESSSRDTKIDTAPPKDDSKNHPNSGAGITDHPDDASNDVQEMHPWDPYRATKDNEVADFYFKQKDYKAALARSQDALIYKPNDAAANFRAAQCYEKLNQPEEAIPHYQAYLKVLPNGPLAKDAKKQLAKLGASEKQTSQKIAPQ